VGKFAEKTGHQRVDGRPAFIPALLLAITESFMLSEMHTNALADGFPKWTARRVSIAGAARK
jgi:hypothetical protein